MFKKNIPVYLLIFIVLIGIFYLLPEFRTNESRQDLIQSADLAADYLMRNIGSEGRFIYRINMNPDVKVKSKYNLLRHAGTMYALATYNRKNPQENVEKVLLQSGGWLKENALEPLLAPEVLSEEPIYAIWSKASISGSDIDRQAKLGGAGLGLVALCSLEAIKSGFTEMEKLRGLGNFILFMQKETGEFRSKYFPGNGDQYNKWRSLYYPGEAVLGLLELYQIDPDPRWLEGAILGVKYLSIQRSWMTTVPADHWVLIATEKLLGNKDVELKEADRQIFLEHGAQICRSILNEQITDHVYPELVGAFEPDGRTTPAATRLEGLLSARKFLTKDYDILKDNIDRAVDLGIEFLLRSQIKEGSYSGGMPRATMLENVELQKLREADDKRVTEIRIDYVQHALSAWLLYCDQLNCRN